MFPKIKQLIQETANSMGWVFRIQNLRIFWSNNKANGAIVSNIAFLILNQKEITVAQISRDFVNKAQKMANQFGLEKIEATEEGYVEFIFSTTELNNIINEILKNGSHFGQTNLGQGKKVLYEWISANPTGNFHIGHLRNAIIGDCVTRILEFVGFDVSREFYINDAGVQISSASETLFFYYQKHFQKDHQPINKLYPETDYLIPTKLFIEKYDDQFVDSKWTTPKIQDLFIKYIRDYFLENFRQACNQLNIYFDRWYSEKKDIYEQNKITVFLAKIEKAGLTEKKDGAIWFLAQKLGFEKNIVLIKSTGQPTYFVSDWIYHDEKFNRGFEILYDLWGADHDSHVIRIKAGLKALGHPDNFDVDVVQMVALIQSHKTLKLSKRAGNIVAWSEFITTLGSDFARFMLMTRKRTKSLLLDVNLALLKNSKNPVFYVQYAHARTHQLMKKYDQKIIFKKTSYSELGGADNIYEQHLIVYLHQFTSAVVQAATNREPHHIVDYLIALSKKFHSYYQNTPILNNKQNLTTQRMALVKAVSQVLANGLKLIGVNAPTKM